jgi:L-ascorbate metabolism protein UlaG (beta-lactamase superfamily)
MTDHLPDTSRRRFLATVSASAAVTIFGTQEVAAEGLSTLPTDATAFAGQRGRENDTKEQIRLTLIDGPTILIEFGGLRILTDPTFDDPQVYADDEIKTEKLTSPAIPANSLLPIDVVLLSHDQHRDNLDVAGRAFLPKARLVISTLAAERRLGGKTRGLARWSSLTIDLPDGRALKVTGTPARHGPIGFEAKSGEVTGFVLSLEGCSSIYVSGDTVWYPEIAEVARRFHVGLAILFAGASQPRGPFNLTLDTNDALEAASAFRDAQIVAVHNLGWRHYTQSQQDLVTAFEAVGLGGRLIRLTPGSAVALDL